MGEANAGRRINVLSYQMFHKKTIDTLIALFMNGYTDVCVYALPLHYQKKYKPLIEHRPQLTLIEENRKIDCKQLTDRMGYQYNMISSCAEIKAPPDSIFLICGAGIIPKEFYKRHFVINAHPGYLPNVRGLDALKWAVVENQPIGVTTHLIGDYIDAGAILERRLVPYHKNDTFHQVAGRQYQMEIQMLVSAIKKIDAIQFFTDGEGYPIHKRMSQDIERIVYQKFQELVPPPPPVCIKCFSLHALLFKGVCQ